MTTPTRWQRRRGRPTKALVVGYLPPAGEEEDGENDGLKSLVCFLQLCPICHCLSEWDDLIWTILIPVYLDYRNGEREKERERTHHCYCSSIAISIVHLLLLFIHSFLQAMERMLRSHLNEKRLLSRVDELTGSIVFHGNYRAEVKLWLLSLGFWGNQSSEQS